MSYKIRKIVYIFIITLAFFPKVFSATDLSKPFCDPNGVTVVLINGVNNSEDKARKNTDGLATTYNKLFPNNDVKFVALYNETHLGGIGDLLKTYLQRGADKEFTYVDDYDLRSLDIQLEKDLTTQKLLIIGHSQGTLYANALYETINKDDGEMKVVGPLDSSIGVYGIGVAATHIEKGNQYVTSDTDSVINLSRTFMPGQPAPANVHIDTTLFTGENEDPADGGRGHGLVPIYLKYQSQRIIGDISNIINTLKSSDTRSQNKCVTISSRPVADFVKTGVFAVADPTASATLALGVDVVSGIKYGISDAYYLGKALGSGIYVAYQTITDTLGTLLAGLFTNTEPLAIGSGSQIAIVSLPTSSTNSSTKVSTVPTQTNTPVVVPTQTKPVVVAKTVAPKQEPQIVAMNETTQTITKPTQMAVPTIILPFVGAGGGGSSLPIVSAIIVEDATTTATTTDPVVPPEEAPIFTIDSPTQDSFDTDTITFSGTKTDGADVVLDGVATTTSLGTTWQYTAVVPEGISTFSFFAYKNGLVSSSIEKTITVSIPDAPFTIPFLNLPGNLATSSVISGTKEKQSTLHISWEIAGSGGVEIGSAFFGTSTQTRWSVDTLLPPGVYTIHYEYHSSNDGVGGGKFIYNPYYDPTDTGSLSFTPFLSETLTLPLIVHMTHPMGYHVIYNFSDGTVIQTEPSFSNETDIPITLAPGKYGYSFNVYNGSNQVVYGGSTGVTLE